LWAQRLKRASECWLWTVTSSGEVRKREGTINLPITSSNSSSAIRKFPFSYNELLIR
jgi:hypothetical protein